MAVYKRSYKPYEGRLTPEWVRWFVLSRDSLSRLFDSKLIIGFTVLSYVFPIIAGTLIYIILERLKTDNLRRRKRDFFPQRQKRQTRRRNPIRLGK